MGPSERRHEILRILCRRRHETMRHLADELGVSIRTIRRDIEILSMYYPLYTQTGRYMGGVYVVDNYNMDRMYMSDDDIIVLKKLLELTAESELLSSEEKTRLHSIIALYSKPTVQKAM